MRRYVRRNLEAILAVFAGLAMLAAVVLYVYRFHGNPPGQPEDWAAFGDFFGGVINPVIGLATVVLVVITLRVTRKEAEDTRKKMDDQLNLMRDDQVRQDMKRRLDGLLAEWNRLMEEPPNRRLLEGIGATEDGRYLTYRKLLESGSIHKQIHKKSGEYRAEHGQNAQYVHTTWRTLRFDVIPLIYEIDEVCSRYAAASTTHELPNFYRNRVRRTTETLCTAGYVDESMRERFRVGFQQ